MAATTGLSSGTHYEVLGLQPGASAEEIKRAYRRMLRQTHPDVGGSALLFRLVQEAWNVLSDPGKKSAYDRNFGSGGYASSSSSSESADQRRAREAREEAYRREQEAAREHERQRQQWARERAEQERETPHQRRDREYREARDRQNQQEARRREEEARRKREDEERARRAEEERRRKAADLAARLAQALPVHELRLAGIRKSSRRLAISYDAARAKLMKDKNMARLLKEGASIAHLWDIRRGQRQRLAIAVFLVVTFVTLHLIGWYAAPPLALILLILIPFLFGWVYERLRRWIYPQFTVVPMVDELQDRTLHLQNLERILKERAADAQAASGQSFWDQMR